MLLLNNTLIYSQCKCRPSSFIPSFLTLIFFIFTFFMISMISSVLFSPFPCKYFRESSGTSETVIWIHRYSISPKQLEWAYYVQWEMPHSVTVNYIISSAISSVQFKNHLNQSWNSLTIKVCRSDQRIKSP